MRETTGVKRFLTILAAGVLLLLPAAATAHEGRVFVVAYPAGDGECRVVAHALGLVSLDRLGFDVKILSLPPDELIRRTASGDVRLALRPGVGRPARQGWQLDGRGNIPGIHLWGRLGVGEREIMVLVPAGDEKELRFAAVSAVLGALLERIDLELLRAMGTIRFAEGKLTGPLRTFLEERDLL